MAIGLNDSTLQESSTLALGEINKYDFHTDSPAVFKASRGLVPLRSSRRFQR